MNSSKTSTLPFGSHSRCVACAPTDHGIHGPPGAGCACDRRSREQTKNGSVARLPGLGLRSGCMTETNSQKPVVRRATCLDQKEAARRHSATQGVAVLRVVTSSTTTHRSCWCSATRRFDPIQTTAFVALLRHNVGTKFLTRVLQPPHRTQHFVLDRFCGGAVGRTELRAIHQAMMAFRWLGTVGMFPRPLGCSGIWTWQAIDAMMVLLAAAAVAAAALRVGGVDASTALPASDRRFPAFHTLFDVGKYVGMCDVLSGVCAQRSAIANVQINASATFSGLAVQPSSGVLFGVGSDMRVHTIDSTSGTGSAREGTLMSAARGLAFEPRSGRLYAFSIADRAFVEVDAAAGGLVDALPRAQLDADVRDFAFDVCGGLVAFSTSQSPTVGSLTRVDVDTGDTVPYCSALQTSRSFAFGIDECNRMFVLQYATTSAGADVLRIHSNCTLEAVASLVGADFVVGGGFAVVDQNLHACPDVLQPCPSGRVLPQARQQAATTTALPPTAVVQTSPATGPTLAPPPPPATTRSPSTTPPATAGATLCEACVIVPVVLIVVVVVFVLLPLVAVVRFCARRRRRCSGPAPQLRADTNVYSEIVLQPRDDRASGLYEAPPTRKPSVVNSCTSTSAALVAYGDTSLVAGEAEVAARNARAAAARVGDH